VVNGVGEPRRILHERRKQASFHGEVSLTGLIVIKDTTMNISRGLKAAVKSIEVPSIETEISGGWEVTTMTHWTEQHLRHD
jgi:hypothetical protein